jgi:hypothetical protein
MAHGANVTRPVALSTIGTSRVCADVEVLLDQPTALHRHTTGWTG